MNHQHPEKPVELSIDVEQWKRDIQTFTETTSRALNAIAAELSNDCSNGHVQGNREPGTTVERFTSCSGDQSFVKTASSGGDRLAQLKTKLAKRIN